MKIAILEKEVEIRVQAGNIKHYKNMGYAIPTYISKRGASRYDLGEPIIVRVEDLPKSSHVNVTKVCDKCGGKRTQSYGNIIKSRKKEFGFIDFCMACSQIRRRELESPVYHDSLEVTHPNIATLLKNKERSKELSYGSNKKEDFICYLCDFVVVQKTVSRIVEDGLSCPRCSDGKSYSERFMFNLLTQIDVEFRSEEVFEWSKGKVYDFYVPSLNCIIETHGIQHYQYSGWNRSLLEEQENDILKKQMALENDIDIYIVIDCRKSEKTFVKDMVLNSDLSRIFSLSSISWDKCHKNSLETLVKTTCDLWGNGIEDTEEISILLNLNRSTVINYLKKGAEIGWCNYDTGKIRQANGSGLGSWAQKNLSKKVVQLSLDGKHIKTWSSISEAQRILKVFGVSCVCRGVRKTAGGFSWLYLEDYEN